MPAAAGGALPRGRADAIQAKEHSLRLRAQLKPGQPFRPTPLQAWRQAADDVAYNRPVKPLLVRLRNARADSDFSRFSFADTQLSEYEVRIVANALRKAICAPVFRRPLRELDLRGCDIDVAKAAHLGRGLAGNVSIERLTLRNNPLTADGVELIVRGIVESMRLVGDEQEYDAWGRRMRAAGGASGSEAGSRVTGGASATSRCQDSCARSPNAGRLVRLRTCLPHFHPSRRERRRRVIAPPLVSRSAMRAARRRRHSRRHGAQSTSPAT
jgi:hypothetical protein